MSFYLDLFLSYLKIGLFSIGGGRAAIPIVQSVVVTEKGWLTLAEFTDVITISEMTPGPFGINSATFIGVKLGGVLGGLVATIGSMLAPLIIVTLLAFLFTRYKKLTVVRGALMGVRPAVTGLLASAGLSIICLAMLGTSTFNADSSLNLISLTIGVICYVLLRKFKTNSVFIIFMAGVLGVLLYALQGLIAG